MAGDVPRVDRRHRGTLLQRRRRRRNRHPYLRRKDAEKLVDYVYVRVYDERKVYRENRDGTPTTRSPGTYFLQHIVEKMRRKAQNGTCNDAGGETNFAGENVVRDSSDGVGCETHSNVSPSPQKKTKSEH